MHKMFLGLLLCPGLLFAQELVKPEELKYFSNEEKEAFATWLNGEPDHLALFIALDPGISQAELTEFRSQYLEGIGVINRDRLFRKKNEARINFLYKEIHDTFFKVYEEENHFSRIFKEGRYNCVSASAFYSLVFEDLDIPYTIRENPTHVYLVAYPETDKLLVETTSPGAGPSLYSDAFKKQFISKLAENKLISNDEYEQGELNSLFDKYYFNDENINLDQLVGIQYLNDAIYRLEDEDLWGAWHQSRKAWILYPAQKAAYLNLSIALQLIESAPYYEKPETIEVFLSLTRFGEFGVNNEMVLGEFSRVMNSILTENNDRDRMQEVYEQSLDYVKDETLKKEIRFAYNYEQGRQLFNLGQYREALPLVAEAHKADPEHLTGLGLFASCLLQHIKTEPDAGKRAAFLEEKISTYPQLEQNANITTLLAASYLEEFTKYYRLEMPEEGDQWRIKFEAMYDEEVSMNVPFTILGEAYSAAAVYYYRRGYRTKARQILEKGLEISPGNFELEQRLRMIR